MGVFEEKKKRDTLNVPPLLLRIIEEIDREIYESMAIHVKLECKYKAIIDKNAKTDMLTRIFDNIRFSVGKKDDDSQGESEGSKDKKKTYIRKENPA